MLDLFCGTGCVEDAKLTVDDIPVRLALGNSAASGLHVETRVRYERVVSIHCSYSGQDMGIPTSRYRQRSMPYR